MHMERWSTLRHLLRYVGATESAKGERERERAYARGYLDHATRSADQCDAASLLVLVCETAAAKIPIGLSACWGGVGSGVK